VKIGDYQQENLAKFGYRAYVKVLKKESYYVLATMVVEI
jgi:hypothetical protein